ncbi:porin [Paludisphaera rhizosphaerae]|uniref:porin n=1 Tax=Paludisphaera rhizosphaerae TaxID=2711216 RepID=UPI0019818006|nr:porin [Paludisphaera rhizosphaerae]
MLRTLAAIPLLLLAFEGAVGGEEPSTADVLKELMKRIDTLEEQNKDLRNKLEKSGEAENPDEQLRRQVQELQDRLNAIEKNREPHLPAAIEDKDVEPAPAAGTREDGSFSDYMDGKVVEPSKKPGVVAKKPDAGGEPPKADAPTKAPTEFVVGKQKKMSGEWNNGLQFRSEDDAFSLHVGGRVDFDNVWYQPTAKNMRFGSDNATRLADGSSFRRMRLRTDGRLYDWVDFVFEVNFANLQDFSNQSAAATTVGAVGITDSNLTFREIPVLGNVRVGHFLAPISLEHMTSSNFVYYMERSPQFDAFVNRFDYVNGINFFNTYLHDRVTLSSALFRSGSTTINPFGAGAGDGEYAFAIRSTGLPIYEDGGRKLIHLGMTVMERTLDNHSSSPGDRALVRAGATKTDLPNVMQTGTFYSPYGEYYLNPEIAMILGRFSLSGEYLWSFAPSAYTGMTANSVLSGPVGRLDYHGFYVESGYFLTRGDYRRYNKKQGSWDRTVPLENAWCMRGPDGKLSTGRGAVQLLARFSYLDLVSGDPVLTAKAGARAGVENDVTLGVAWYINPQANMQVNYVHTQINSVLRSASGSFDGLGLRFHYDF